METANVFVKLSADHVKQEYKNNLLWFGDYF